MTGVNVTSTYKLRYKQLHLYMHALYRQRLICRLLLWPLASFACMNLCLCVCVYALWHISQQNINIFVGEKKVFVL